MHGNDSVTDRCADDAERQIADADPQNILESPTGGGYFRSDPISTYYIFTTIESISTWYNIDDAKAVG